MEALDFERIHQRAWQHIADSVVEDIVRQIELLPDRHQLFVIASTGEPKMREGRLGQIEAQLSRSGISSIRLSGRRDPFLDGLRRTDCILLDEAPLVPHLEAATREHPIPWIVTADLKEWIRAAQEIQPVDLYLIPRERLPKDGKPTVQFPAHREASTVHLLASVDVPLPVSLFTRIGIDALRVINDSELLTVHSVEGVEYLLGTDALRRNFDGVLRTAEDTESLRRVLQRLINAASPAEAGLIAAILRRLALHGGQSLAATIVKRTRPALQRLENDELEHRRIWAVLYRELDLHQIAREVLEEAVAEEGESLSLQHARATLFAREGSYDRALMILGKLKNDHPRNVYVLHTTAHTLFKMGHLSEAERVLEEALGIEEDNVYVWSTLGQIAAARRDFNGADRHFQEALEWSPGNAVVLNAWAKAKARQGAFDEAIQKLEQAKGIEHWNPRHYVDLASLLKERGHLEQAREEAELALDADAQNLYALTTLADIETECEKWEEAAKYLEEGLEIEETPQLHTVYGTMEGRREDRLEEAVRHFRQALRLDPKNVRARTAWADLLIRVGQLHSAADILSDVPALETLPAESRAVVLNTWGKLYAAWREFTEAAAYLKRSYNLDPHNIITLNTWGDIEIQWWEWLRDQEQTEEAEAHRKSAGAHYQEALGLDPENAHTHRAYARFLEKVGLIQDALDHLQRAQDLGLDTHTVHEDIKRLTERINRA